MFPSLIAKLKHMALARSWARVIAFLFLLDLTPALSQTTTQPFFVHLWQMEDGLPQSAIPAILQTSDGFLWICTYAGLVRFDGQHFKVFDEFNTPGLINSRVTCLFEDADGSLLIGHETGTLTRFKNGQFEPVEFHATWRNRTIDDINSDEHGDVWLFNADQQLARLRDGKILTPIGGGPFAYGRLIKGDNGLLWVMNTGTISMMKNGELIPVNFDGLTPGTIIQGIAHSRRGGFWIACEGHIKRWYDHRWVEDLGAAPWGSGTLAAFLEMKDGYLAAATFDQDGQGLYLISPKGDATLFNRANKFSSDWIRCLYEDREGNLWAGSGNSGLAMVRHTEITAVNPPDSWQGRAVLSVCPGRDNSLWVGTEGAGIYRLQAGKWRHYDEEDGLSNMYVWSVLEDTFGRLWAGTWGYGLFERENDHFKPLTVTSNFQVTALLQGHDGCLWVGTGAGLMKLQPDGQAVWSGPNNGSGWSQVKTILQDGTNQLWFGMAGGGLGCNVNGTFHQFRKSDGLSSDFINCLYRDADGALWIGTAGGGLDRFKNGHFASITTQQGLPNNEICDIENDGHGYFWISTRGGILRVSREALNDCVDGTVADLDCRIYGKYDGMPTIGCSGGFQPASCRTVDGRIWFPTGRGLVIIDPNDVKTNLLAAPVVIEQLSIDGIPHDVAYSPAPLRIPPGQHRLEFSFAGLSFVAPEKVRYKFKLEGLEQDWVSDENISTATFNDVPPGKYTFQVTACNNDGIWNDAGAAFAFIVLPHFWQTAWFKMTVWFGGVLIVSCGVWLDTRRRLHRKLEHTAHLHALERERYRIAMDIHDHFGARLTQMTYLCQIIRRKINEPDLAISSLDNLHSTVRKVTREMDEIVWAVNPKHDTLDSLAIYFGKFAQEFLQSAGVRCRLNFPLMLPAWRLTAETRHNLFLSFQEALNNVVKHAAATQVDVSLIIEQDSFKLIVQDNGHGFNSQAIALEVSNNSDRLSRGNGLTSMRQRQVEIGGSFDISSELGKGTKIVFTIGLKRSAHK
jgi:signal transduction histidine kinase/ligand-binding sensor domain-containing protein